MRTVWSDRTPERHWRVFEKLWNVFIFKVFKWIVIFIYFQFLDLPATIPKRRMAERVIPTQIIASTRMSVLSPSPVLITRKMQLKP